MRSLRLIFVTPILFASLGLSAGILEDELFKAAQNNNVARAQELIDQGADIYYRGYSDQWERNKRNSPLAEAVFRGNVEVAKVLIEERANLGEGNLLQDAAASKNPEMIKLIYKARRWKKHELISAFFSADMDLAPTFLELGVNINDTDGYEKTYLFRAIERSSPKHFAYALKKGADIFHLNREKQTIVVAAAKTHKLSNVKMVLAVIPEAQRAAMINSVEGGETAISAAIDSELSGGGGRVLNLNSAWAIERRTEEQNIIKLLVANGGDINTSNGYMSPYLHAVRSLRWDILDFLVSLGADPRARGWKGMNAYHLAIDNRAPDLEQVPLVLKEVASHGVDINGADDEGKTALHYAARSGYRLEEIIALQKDMNIRDNFGNTALHYAIYGEPKNIQRLITAGVDPKLQNLNRETPADALKALVKSGKYYGQSSYISILEAFGEKWKDRD